MLRSISSVCACLKQPQDQIGRLNQYVSHVLGSSRRSPSKCVPAPAPNLDCVSNAGNPEYRAKADRHGDTFYVYRSGSLSLVLEDEKLQIMKARNFETPARPGNLQDLHVFKQCC